MSQPRPQIYTFAHRMLPLDVQREPNLWSIVTGDRAHGYVQTRWNDAAAGGPSLPIHELQWVAPIREGAVEIAILRMPPPQAPTEPHFVAFVRDGSPLLRYFVLEQSATEGAYWAEWRAGMRIRGGVVPMWPPDQARAAALPLPYLAAFVDAIVGETRNGPPQGVPVAPRRPRPSSRFDKPWMALVPIAVVAIAIAINPCTKSTESSAYTGPTLAAPTYDEVARSNARIVIDDARRKLATCELPSKLNSVIERTGRLQVKVPVGTNQAALKRAKVDQIFAALDHQKRVAAAVGGFSCEIAGLDDLKALVAKTSPSPELRDVTAKVRAATDAFTPATIAVGTHSFCDLKDKKCKAALIWVDVATQKPIATLWQSSPWAGAEADNESIRRMTAAMLAQVAAW